MHTWRVAPILVLALGAVAAAPGAAQERYAISGREVAIYNLAGQAEIVRGSGSEVRVTLTRHGDDAEQLEVETGRIDGRETLRVIYPGDNIVYGSRRNGSTDLRVRDDGTFFDQGRGGRRVRVRSSGRGLEAWADLRIEVPADHDLSIYVAAGEVTAQGMQGALHVDVGAATVGVEEHNGPVSIDTGSGDVWVRGVEGDVVVDTGSGGVEMERVSGSRVDIDTGSGGIRGSTVSAESARFDTGSGSVSMEELRSPVVVVDTGSGEVFLDVTVDVERLEVDTGSGAVTLALPEQAGAELELETGSGGIDVDLPIRISQSQRDYLRGILGDGRGHIEVDTGSGGIRIRSR
ncbi:MAG: DUF4097 family beta strand repeat-containing protein [Gemmatimonadota bacterium]